MQNEDNEYFGYDKLVDLTNMQHANNFAPSNQNQQARDKGCQQPMVQFSLDDDDAGLDGAGATGTIMLPLFSPRVKFNITRTMFQLLNLKGCFGGLPSDDPNMHLVNFLNICKYFDYP